MKRETARDYVSRAFHAERRRQLQMYPERHDDDLVETSLLIMVGVLSKYLGNVASEGVAQSDGKDVDWDEVGRDLVKLGTVSFALAESLVATDKIAASSLVQK